MRETVKHYVFTSYRISNPPSDGVFGAHEWLAVATAHIWPDEESVSVKTVSGKGTASSEQGAFEAALEGVMDGVAGAVR